MSKLKSAREILESMGFKEKSPESTQMAFFRYLKKEAASSSEPPPTPPSEPEQLEFDLQDHGLKSWTTSIKSKKVSNQ